MLTYIPNTERDSNTHRVCCIQITTRQQTDCWPRVTYEQQYLLTHLLVYSFRDPHYTRLAGRQMPLCQGIQQYPCLGSLFELCLFDVRLMLALGLGGYLLRKLDYPVAPAVLAIVLGPLAERSMRQSLIGSRGDAFTFINPAEHPISLACIIVAILLMLYPVFLSFRRKRTKKVAT